MNWLRERQRFRAYGDGVADDLLEPLAVVSRRVALAENVAPSARPGIGGQPSSLRYAAPSEVRGQKSNAKAQRREDAKGYSTQSGRDAFHPRPILFPNPRKFGTRRSASLQNNFFAPWPLCVFALNPDCADGGIDSQAETMASGGFDFA